MGLLRWRRGAAGVAVICAAGMLGAAGMPWTVTAGAAGRPAAELSIDPAQGPLTVTLVANSAGFPARVVSYFFRFGDGHSVRSTSRKVVHTYPAAGRFTPEVTETDADGNTASANGTLQLGTCSAGPTCTKTLRNVGGVKRFSATGNIQVGAAAAINFFVGPYRIKNCDPAVETDGALTDTGFTGHLTVTVVYHVTNPALVHRTCFSSVVPFADAEGHTVKNGPLPKCSKPGAVPPCVVSITPMTTASGEQVTKVLRIPPGDPKVGAL
jgi:hypothetical protein